MTEIDQATVLKAAELFKQWMFTAGGDTRTLVPATEFVEGMDNRYGLKNVEINKFVGWEDGQLGIDLGYKPTEVPRWIVSRCVESTEPIKYGETIAIGLGIDPTWINFEEQTFGINLGYQSKASCEWRILGGTIGTPVQTNERVALFNEKSMASESVKGEPMVYLPRPPKHFDAGWPTSQGLLDNLGDLFKNLGEAIMVLTQVLDLYESVTESDEQPNPGQVTEGPGAVSG